MTHLGKTKRSLKKNDQVQIIAGREKGKTGKVVEVDVELDRILVEGVNIVTRHKKGTQGAAGSIVSKEAFLNYSNVLLFCPRCNRGVRHGVKNLAGGKKARVCKRCDETIDPA